jgi:hypothetical protein
LLGNLASLGLVVHKSFIIPSIEEGIMSIKKQKKVNEDTIGNEIVTSDQLVNCKAHFPTQNPDVLFFLFIL